MNGDATSLPHTPSWRAKMQLCSPRWGSTSVFLRAQRVSDCWSAVCVGGSVWEHVQYADSWNLPRFNVVHFKMWQNQRRLPCARLMPWVYEPFLSIISVQFVISLSLAAFPYSTKKKMAHLHLSVVTLKSSAVWTSEVRQCSYCWESWVVRNSLQNKERKSCMCDLVCPSVCIQVPVP